MSTDYAAIKQTLAAYCHRVDRGTADDVAALFAPDAVLKPYYDGEYDVNGRDAIRSWYAFYHEKLGGSVRHLKHLIHSIAIDLNGDRAASVCYLTAYFIMKEDNVAYQAQGTYNDTLVRVDDVWLFETRRIDVEFVTPLNNVIEAMEPMGFPGAAN